MAKSAKRIKTTQISIRVEPAFKAAAEAAAALDTRSLASLIEKLLRDHMRSIGIDPDARPPTEP